MKLFKIENTELRSVYQIIADDGGVLKGSVVSDKKGVYFIPDQNTYSDYTTSELFKIAELMEKRDLLFKLGLTNQ